MYTQADFDPIDVNEQAVLTLDFAKYPLGSGETLASVIWTCTVADGVDATPSSRLLGAPSISGTQTLQKVGTMLAGVKYRLAAQVTTSRPQILNLYSFILCQDPATIT
jgi:hypothetical protein